MSRGIYIMANDRVINDVIALINSIRAYDPHTPIVMIPYDESYQKAAQFLDSNYGVSLYPDLSVIDRIINQLNQIFGQNFFARVNQFRKLACWLGEFDEFLYIDTDIIVFEKIIDTLNYLADYDFIYCDTQYLDMKSVFTEEFMKLGLLSLDRHQRYDQIFNCGFFGSKKEIFTETEIFETFKHCANHLEYFDFSRRTSDQPMMNYLMMTRVPRRYNLVRPDGNVPISWAGKEGFKVENYRLFDTQLNQPVKFIHWSGFRIAPGCPYWEVWEYYRYLKTPQWQKQLDQLKDKFPQFTRLGETLERGLQILKRNPQEQYFLIKAAQQILKIKSEMQSLPFEKWWSLLEQRTKVNSGKNPNNLPINQIIWAVTQSNKLAPKLMRPFVQTVAAQVLLAQLGYATELRIGVVPVAESGKFKAKAWLEHQGEKIIIDGCRTDLFRYTALPSLKEEGLEELKKLFQTGDIDWNY